MHVFDKSAPSGRVKVIAVTQRSELGGPYPEAIGIAFGSIVEKHLLLIDLCDEPRLESTFKFSAEGYVLLAGLSSMIQAIYTSETTMDILVEGQLGDCTLIKFTFSKFDPLIRSNEGCVEGPYEKTSGPAVTLFAAEIFGK